MDPNTNNNVSNNSESGNEEDRGSRLRRSNQQLFELASQRLQSSSGGGSQGNATTGGGNNNSINLVPYNGNPNFLSGYSAISIESLSGDRPKRSDTVLALQLLCIVSGTNQDQKSSSSTNSYTYFSKHNKISNYLLYLLVVSV